MKKIYLLGHNNFGNRGCEALVRSISILIQKKFGEVIIYCPSIDKKADSRQWPQSSQYGIRFVDPPIFPFKIKLFSKIVKLLPFMQRITFPRFFSDSNLPSELLDSDFVIATGGDNLTQDYGLAPLLWNASLMKSCIDRKLPLFLWGASIGPFKEDFIKLYVLDVLRGTSKIFVREPKTLNFLSYSGIDNNISRCFDPAFTLEVESTGLVVDVSNNKEMLGLNISPLVVSLLDDDKIQEVVSFVNTLTEKYNMQVLLIPHVDPISNKLQYIGDHAILKVIYDKCNKDNLVLVGPTYNAAQLKYIISRCTYFIGARTHSTIAAFSSMVPTVSISYSVKSVGLNVELFGDKRYVLEGGTISADSLRDMVDKIIRDKEAIVDTLVRKKLDLEEAAKKPVDEIYEYLRAH